MKRKRGGGRRKPKLGSVVGAEKPCPNSVSPNSQDEYHEGDFDNADFDSGMNTETTQNGGRMTRLQSANLLKKARSTMTASSLHFDSSSVKPINDAEQMLAERTGPKDRNSSYLDPEYNAQELKAALAVVKEVMKMDAAEPFNVPVDPIALGIADYFDIVDTPIDFGTICSNLESGVKYRSSNDVFRDVQYIWDNCCKYNKKGHYVLELMKRVKRKFTKLWMEAGLHMDQQQENDANLSKKARSMMTVSSRGFESSSVKLISDAEQMVGDRTHQTGTNSSYPDSQCKPHELKAALEVIREVMKMDAAEPFNVPVDPIALGIPDYFDVIDTPMDFGTICSNLENGIKYKSSKDVLWDVQCVWDNCCKYNKKGHYVLELMKRVKRNFTKLWIEAGLYWDQQQEIDGHLHLPPTTSQSRICGHRTPLDSMAEYARQQQQNLTRLQSYLPQERPCQPQQSSGQQQTSRPQIGKNVSTEEAPKRWSSYVHGYTIDPTDENMTHSQQKLRGNSDFQLQQNQHILGHGQAYQPQERSCQCHPSSRQLPSHQDCEASITDTGYSCLPCHVESTLKESAHGHRCKVSPANGDPACLLRNNTSLNQQLHHHCPSVSCSQQYQHQEGSFECHPGCGQLHPSKSMAVTDTASAEQVSLPHPEESMIRCRKRGMQRTFDPMADSMRLQQKDEMATNYVQPHEAQQGTCRGHLNSNSGQKQSSQPQDDVEMGHFCSTPAVESMMRNTKRAARYPAVPMNEYLNHQQPDETAPSQMQSHQPQQETSQGCISSRLQQPSRPLVRIDVATPDSSSTKRKNHGRGRGPTRCLNLWNRRGKIAIATNEFGQPIGPEAPKLTNFLGTIARDGHMSPLNYVDWRALPEENKEMMWQHVQAKFDIDPDSKHWVLKSIGNKWKNFKAQLKATHYNPHETDEERLADRDERVLPDQWKTLVTFWSSKEAQERSATNKTNRSKMKTCHTTGTKSFARVREEERVKRPDGKEPSRAELFILTRTRKDGRPVNEASSAIISQLKERAAGKEGISENGIVDDNIFFEVMGEDRHGRVRTYGLGPAPSDVGGPKPNRAEAIRMVSEANAEVREMKERMVAMEQTCQQMAAQMATMMSMMSNMHNNNIPDKHQPNIVSSPSEPLHAEQAADISNNSGGSQQMQFNLSSIQRSEVKRGKKQQARVGKTKFMGA
ncbi:hypothetical protein NMG60_11032526 [Bertholletia excelsa]